MSENSGTKLVTVGYGWLGGRAGKCRQCSGRLGGHAILPDQLGMTVDRNARPALLPLQRGSLAAAAPGADRRGAGRGWRGLMERDPLPVVRRRPRLPDPEAGPECPHYRT